MSLTIEVGSKLTTRIDPAQISDYTNSLTNFALGKSRVNQNLYELTC